MLKGPKTVAAIRQQRQEQMAKQQQAAAMTQGAEIANKASGAVSNLSSAQVGQGRSALEGMLSPGQ